MVQVTLLISEDLCMDSEKMENLDRDWTLVQQTLRDENIPDPEVELQIIETFACSTYQGSIMSLLTSRLQQEPRTTALALLDEHFTKVNAWEV